MSQPLQKRKRLLSEDSDSSLFKLSPDPSPPTKSSDLYFDDGNIILIVEDVAFRVHRGQLARHSQVFRDMLCVVDQPVGAEVFDGCPTVRLSDTSGDVQMLLHALYDYTQFVTEDVITVTTVLRLATKYLIEPLRKSAINALQIAYPDTLTKWDKFKGDRKHPQLVIRLINADILLPAAFYELCGTSFCAFHDRGIKLPQHILEVYCRGREELTAKLIDFVREEIMENLDVRPRCGLHACDTAWEDTETEVLSLLQDSDNITNPDPLQVLQELPRNACFDGMCKACRSKVKTAIRQARMDIWVSLPRMFDLESWKKLRGAE